MGKNGGLDKSPISGALAAAEHFSALGNRLCNPLFHSLRIGFANKRTNVNRFIQRIATLECFHLRQQSIEKLLISITLHENPLHRDAALPGIGEAAEGTTRD